jgi:hypothetical protein
MGVVDSLCFMVAATMVDRDFSEIDVDGVWSNERVKKLVGGTAYGDLSSHEKPKPRLILVHNAELVADPFVWFNGAAGPNKLIFEFHALPWKKNFNFNDWMKSGKVAVIKFEMLSENDMKIIALHCNLTPSSELLTGGDATRMCVALSAHNGAKDRSITAMSETEAIVRGKKTDIDHDMTPYVIHEHSWKFVGDASLQKTLENAAQLSENLAYADALNPSTQYDQAGRASMHTAPFLGLAAGFYANLKSGRIDLSGPLRSMKAQPEPNLKRALIHLSMPFKVSLKESSKGLKYFKEGQPESDDDAKDVAVDGAPALDEQKDVAVDDAGSASSGSSASAGQPSSGQPSSGQPSSFSPRPEPPAKRPRLEPTAEANVLDVFHYPMRELIKSNGRSSSIFRSSPTPLQGKGHTLAWHVAESGLEKKDGIASVLKRFNLFTYGPDSAASARDMWLLMAKSVKFNPTGA